MIVIHHLENSRSQRILWLFEELGLDYEIRHYQRDPETRLAPPSLRDVHPLGKAPLVTIDDLVLAESGAIIDYVIRHFGDGQLLPAPESPEGVRYSYWLHYAEGSLMPLLLLSLVFTKVETAPMPFFLRPVAKGIAGKVRESFITPNLERNLVYLDAELARHTWFAGEAMSGADIMLSFPIEAAESRVGLNPRYPHLAAFLERIRARAAYQRALEKGGPYDLGM